MQKINLKKKKKIYCKNLKPKQLQQRHLRGRLLTNQLIRKFKYKYK